MANSYLEVRLDTVRRNVKSIQADLGERTKLIPVLKGNAYGLGAVRLAKDLSEMAGIDTFAVAQTAEGLELRNAGIRDKIMVMSLPLRHQVRTATEQNLILTLGAFHQFDVLRDVSKELGKKIAVQLKLDTGLHRIGFLPEEMERLCDCLRESSQYLQICGTFSHFSCNSTKQLQRQAELFRIMTCDLTKAGIEPGLCHMSSSGSMEAGPDWYFDAVRIGRRLYMDSPDTPTGTVGEAVSFRAWLTDIRQRRRGDTLAYGGKTVLASDSRIGVLSVGYGDGLDPGFVGKNAPVLVNGQRATLLDVCMDQSFVALDGIDCSPGDEVTLFGYDRSGNILPSQDVAALLDREGCDLTTRITDRVNRVYIEGEDFAQKGNGPAAAGS
ncbi:MAG: alanine racemase [Oscillospiraceae bacterium]|nr:alanine racemase [Oscillospiraceae bacterium]